MQSTRLVRREVLYILRATCFFLSRFCGRNLTCHFGFGFQDFHSNVWCGISLPSKSHVQRPCTRMHGREEEQQQHQAAEEEEESAKICIISVFIKGFTFLQDRKKAPGHWNCLNDIYANFSASIFFPSQCSFVHFCVLNEVKEEKKMVLVVVIFIVKVFAHLTKTFRAESSYGVWKITQWMYSAEYMTKSFPSSLHLCREKCVCVFFFHFLLFVPISQMLWNATHLF